MFPLCQKKKKKQWLKLTSSEGARYYDDNNMKLTAGYLKSSLFDVHSTSSVQWLLRARVGCVPRAYGLAAAKLPRIDPVYRTRCIMCKQDGFRDTVEHMAGECTAFEGPRQAYLVPLWNRYAAELRRLGMAVPERTSVALFPFCD